MTPRTLFAAAALVACGLVTVVPRVTLAQSAPPSTRADSTGARVASDHPLPRTGQVVRITVPGLPLAEGHLHGTFAGVDSTAAPWMVMITTPAGARSVPCANIATVDVRVDHHIPLWQQGTVIAVSAVAGVMILHYFVHNRPSYDVYGNPAPWTREREHKERERTTIAGVLLGGGTAAVAVHDRARWQPASLGTCTAR